ncbi:anti-anti-sigma factor [Allocatelliglobosispora scoriae]|uniref:Anti-anti-sigma factor n=1 Tax=Allocatelliglobosispora scoriae TaxID=643052 RepID=A0A841BG83_9ACTN|nr:STAS domain-containing protein [Allocatelliglobosispora scoriae]MBB5868097.1 anti-anti-sigma factor [Allocatelliglobosispora scoriae]
MNNPPGDPMTIGIVTALRGAVVCVRLTGDVCLPGESELDRAAVHLAATGCRSVYVDLAGVTFAGSVLANFLCALSTRSSLVLCGPSPLVQRIIEVTGLDRVARIVDRLPADWAVEGTLASATT